MIEREPYLSLAFEETMVKDRNHADRDQRPFQIWMKTQSGWLPTVQTHVKAWADECWERAKEMPGTKIKRLDHGKLVGLNS